MSGAGLRGNCVGASSACDSALGLLRRLSPYVKTSHCLVVQWDGFVLDPSMWSNDFLRFDYIGPIWERFRDQERCSCTGGFTLRSRRLLAALLDEPVVSQKAEDVCIALEYREYLERNHDIRYAAFSDALRFALEDVYESPSAFGFHGVHNLLCILSSVELEDFMANSPEDVFAGFRMRRFINHALKEREIALAHRALVRRQSSRKLDMSDVRLWMRLSRAYLLQGWSQRRLKKSRERATFFVFGSRAADKLPLRIPTTAHECLRSSVRTSGTSQKNVNHAQYARPRPICDTPRRCESTPFADHADD